MRLAAIFEAATGGGSETLTPICRIFGAPHSTPSLPRTAASTYSSTCISEARSAV